jgi:N-acetylglucosamine kinase-like BadF-type ATPase
LGAVRLALVGGLASSLRSWLATATALQLVEPLGDALDGAQQLARSAVVAQARVA